MKVISLPCQFTFKNDTSVSQIAISNDFDLYYTGHRSIKENICQSQGYRW
jgi:hypothetical protein